MKNLILYTSPRTRGTYVRWMLEECGADYETVAMPLDALKSPDYLAVNSLGKVPVLKAGGTVLTETLGIITWLAELFPEKNLIPAVGSVERGEYYRWLCFALQLEYACMDKRRGIENTAEQRIGIGYGDFDAAVDVLRQRLKDHEHIVGSGFSALDLYYSGCLAWLINVAEIMPAEQVFSDYMNRHFARPAFSKTQALDKADEDGLAQQVPAE